MKKLGILTFICLALVSQTFSQGCSDAGICSITTAPSHDSSSVVKNTLELGYTFGKGLEDVIYNNAFIGYSRTWKESWKFSSRLTYNQASGNFGTLGRLGDVFLILDHTKKINTTSAFKPSLGLKVPLSTSNAKINNISLPLDYQSSLGTLDILIGANYNLNKWGFDAAFQFPVWQVNRNSFFDEFSRSDVFPTTNLFERKPDALIRTSYSITTKNNKWLFKPNTMAIYHTGDDTYEDIFGQRQVIQNSKGITINASLSVEHRINAASNLHINIASPLVVREIRPDGLTRAIVASISYEFKF